MNSIDIFRPCSQVHKNFISENTKKRSNRRIDVTTRILGIQVREGIDRSITLKNGKKLRFNYIPPGVYRVREYFTEDGKYGWQFINPETGGILCGHNREALLMENLVKINIISESCL